MYLAIACFVFILAFVFFCSWIPEVTDADMQFQVQETHIEGTEKGFWKQYRLFHAAFAQFCYTGAQVGIAGDVLTLTLQGQSELNSDQAISSTMLLTQTGCRVPKERSF